MDDFLELLKQGALNILGLFREPMWKLLNPFIQEWKHDAPSK